MIDRDVDSYREEAARQLSAAADADRRDGEIDDWIVEARGDLRDDPKA